MAQPDSNLSKSSSQNGSYNDYGTAYDPQHSSEREWAENPDLAFQREVLMNEYNNDKDAIQLAIKQALKSRNYKEAQEFVYKYRIAAKVDETFAVLARMTAQGLENDKKIEKIVTVLDATPNDDYETRIALYERILKVLPDSEFYRAELERTKSERDAANPQMAKANVPAAKSDNPLRFVFTVLIVLAILGLIAAWLSPL